MSGIVVSKTVGTEVMTF